MPRRRIKSATISHVSLCRAGKNRLPTIFKSDNGADNVRVSSLLKANGDFDVKGELLSVVYAPEIRDTDGDIASEDAIKEMAYSFAKSGKGIDIEHDGKVLPRDAAYVAESFLIQKGDSRFAGWKDDGGAEVDVSGGWGMVVKIDDPELRQLYKSGAWNGVSMFGEAMVEAEKSSADVDSFMDAFMRRLGLSARVSVYGDLEMTPDELKTLFKSEITPAIATAVGDAIGKALKPAEPAPAAPVAKSEPTNPFGIKAPIFKGSLSDPEAISKFAREKRLYKAACELDTDDPDALEAFAAMLQEEGVTEPAPARKAAPSNAPESQKKDGEFVVEGLTGDDVSTAMAAAKAMSGFVNKSRRASSSVDSMA